MNLTRKIEWLEAIDKLIKHYEKFPLDAIPDSIGTAKKPDCPLCNVSWGGCDGCPWVMFEGATCMKKGFVFDNAESRLARLYEWKYKVGKIKLTEA